MFQKFVDWLDGFLLEEGARGIVRAALGLMSFGAVLGVLFGNTAVRAGVMIATILIVLSLLIALVSDRRRLLVELEGQKQLVHAYGDAAWERNFRVVSWEQTAIIESNGDTREYILIHAVIEGGDARFIRLFFGAGWPQPLRYKKRMSVVVRRVDADGRIGTQFRVTKDWRSDGRISVMSHFDTTVGAGADVRFRVEWFWPGKCVPLMVSKQTDSFTFKFGRPVEHAVYRILLPPGVKAYWDPIGFTRGGDVASLQVDEATDRMQFTVDVRRMPVSKPVGVQLELKS
ncbi:MULTISPECIES: hypothetical protein [unclassified Crossiella]|uniref:hypothetical protein n=1 Tax=unclassified Crossiella TaxID=2620835 RepID=UPI0020004401|nr:MULTISPECIES: hypothetical protein [unclassified Crossiella]MCK2238244.1 hypothetical protein [Crossiella sp. S99.2]MCK2256284.1 hypothetical protein [Crossiella sp. S99.1]